MRAIRKGWIKVPAPGDKAKGDDDEDQASGPPVYMLWADDGLVDGAGKTGSGLTHIVASKPRLPGHEESYNPPAEYLPTEVCRGGTMCHLRIPPV